jgi:hypothetical protein
MQELLMLQLLEDKHPFAQGWLLDRQRLTPGIARDLARSCTGTWAIIPLLPNSECKKG